MKSRLCPAVLLGLALLSAALPEGFAAGPGSIQVCVDRLEDGFAVIEAEGGLIFSVPSDAFGLKLAEGQVLSLSASPDDGERKGREDRASAILEGLGGALP